MEKMQTILVANVWPPEPPVLLPAARIVRGSVRYNGFSVPRHLWVQRSSFWHSFEYCRELEDVPFEAGADAPVAAAAAKRPRGGLGGERGSIEMDEEGWFSVTPECLANAMACMAVDLSRFSMANAAATFGLSAAAEPSRPLPFAPAPRATGLLPSGGSASGARGGVVVLDLFAGCGGNAVACARHPEVGLVVAVDISEARLAMAAANARVHGVHVVGRDCAWRGALRGDASGNGSDGLPPSECGGRGPIPSTPARAPDCTHAGGHILLVHGDATVLVQAPGDGAARAASSYSARGETRAEENTPSAAANNAALPVDEAKDEARRESEEAADGGIEFDLATRRKRQRPMEQSDIGALKEAPGAATADAERGEPPFFRMLDLRRGGNCDCGSKEASMGVCSSSSSSSGGGGGGSSDGVSGSRNGRRQHRQHLILEPLGLSFCVGVAIVAPPWGGLDYEAPGSGGSSSGGGKADASTGAAASEPLPVPKSEQLHAVAVPTAASPSLLETAPPSSASPLSSEPVFDVESRIRFHRDLGGVEFLRRACALFPCIGYWPRHTDVAPLLAVRSDPACNSCSGAALYRLEGRKKPTAIVSWHV